jgi:hypothetical protein
MWWMKKVNTVLRIFNWLVNYEKLIKQKTQKSSRLFRRQRHCVTNLFFKNLVKFEVKSDVEPKTKKIIANEIHLFKQIWTFLSARTEPK